MYEVNFFNPHLLAPLFVFLCLPGDGCLGSEQQELHGENSHQPLIITGSRDKPPFTLLDRQREAAGLVVDIWHLWSQKTERPVRFLLTNDDHGSLEALKSGRADVHANLMISAVRSTRLDFSTDFAVMPALLYHSTELGTNRTLADFENSRMGIRGPLPRELLQKSLNKVEVINYETILQMIEAVRRDEIQAFIADPYSVKTVLINRWG
jgi:ABC-type amino acid transport substrate-binding protein